MKPKKFWRVTRYYKGFKKESDLYKRVSKGEVYCHYTTKPKKGKFMIIHYRNFFYAFMLIKNIPSPFDSVAGLQGMAEVIECKLNYINKDLEEKFIVQSMAEDI